ALLRIGRAARASLPRVLGVEEAREGEGLLRISAAGRDGWSERLLPPARDGGVEAVAPEQQTVVERAYERLDLLALDEEAVALLELGLRLAHVARPVEELDERDPGHGHDERLPREPEGIAELEDALALVRGGTRLDRSEGRFHGSIAHER